VVRQRSAKPLFPSSNLGVASKVKTLNTLNFMGLEFLICFWFMQLYALQMSLFWQLFLCCPV
jgi:hypothetical protein